MASTKTRRTVFEAKRKERANLAHEGLAPIDHPTAYPTRRARKEARRMHGPPSQRVVAYLRVARKLGIGWRGYA